MATAKSKKQKLLIQDLLSNPTIYTRCSSILDPKYFDQEYEVVVSYIHKYFEKYKATPAVDLLDAEFDIEFEETKRMSRDRVEASCDEIEKFCKESAVTEAVYQSLTDLDKGEYSAVLDRVTKAVSISLQRDMGVNVFDNPEERMRSLIEEFTPIPTGIDGIDKPLDGGLIRKQFTLFSANSGGGKSVMLANIGANYAEAGYNVVYITLELTPEMIFLRLASIMSGYDASKWKEHIPEMAANLVKINDNGAGMYVLKRLPQGATPADIRSFLTYYEMEFGNTPDVLLIDYLDLLNPNGGISNIGVFEQDKQKSEQTVEILHDYDCIGVSASQQNRDGLRLSSPDQTVIAGGISKINTVDNYISLFMDDTMRLQGEMNAYFLKTRSSSGVGKFSMLNFNTSNLRISDPRDGAQTNVMPTKSSKVSDEVSNLIKQAEQPTAEIEGLPDDDKSSTAKPPQSLFDDDDDDPIMPELTDEEGDELLKLMDQINGD